MNIPSAYLQLVLSFLVFLLIFFFLELTELVELEFDCLSMKSAKSHKLLVIYTLVILLLVNTQITFLMSGITLLIFRASIDFFCKAYFLVGESSSLSCSMLIISLSVLNCLFIMCIRCWTSRFN